MEEESGVAVAALGFQLDNDTVARTETVVGKGGERSWLGDGRAPAGADGPHVHVRVHAAGGGEGAVGDALDELRWKRSPIRNDRSVIEPGAAWPWLGRRILLLPSASSFIAALRLTFK